MASIRRADEHDAAAIAHVQIASWRTTYAGILPNAFLKTLDEARRAEEWRSRLTRAVDAFIAETGGQVTGFICGGAVREAIADCDAELYAVYLLQETQRTGIGSDLLKSLSCSLQRKGFQSMGVWVLEGNPCKMFYVKRGAHYVRTKEIEIAGVKLVEEAYAWTDLISLTGEMVGA